MKYILLGLIRFYQRFISPMKRTRCPYIPTCSVYAAEAVKEYGAVRGSALAVWRLLRCNPFSSGGFDPVPLRSTGYPMIRYVSRGRSSSHNNVLIN